MSMHVNPAVASVHRHSGYMVVFTPKSLTPDWMKRHRMRNTPQKKTQLVGLFLRSSPAASVRQQPVGWDKLVWLSDAVMREYVALGPRGHMVGHRVPCHDEDSMRPGVFTYLAPPPSGSGCFRPDIEIFMFLTPVVSVRASESCRLSKVCLSTDHACCCPPLRGRSPRSLETAWEWIMRTPLIYPPSQSAAVHLESAFNDRVKCTIVAEECLVLELREQRQWNNLFI